MSIDLIRRATERLAQGGKAVQVPQGPAAQPASVAPIQSHAIPDQADVSPAVPAARTSKRISIDQDRLRRLGVITPKTPETTQIAEEFRVIKRPLLLKAFGDAVGFAQGNNHLIMVTSARPGEGKTFVALNLAMSMASEQNLNVLLIDGDVKNPSLPGMLGIQCDKGLLDTLTETDLDLSDVILRTEIENLSFIPAGRPHVQSTELFASRKMAALVQDIARRYNDRVVIIDAPPVLASSEPAVLMLHVGQIVFVVESEVTSRRAVEEALSHVKDCENVHLVLNKSRSWLGKAQFGTYYGYPGR